MLKLLVLAYVLVLAAEIPQALASPPPAPEERIGELETLWNQAHLQSDIATLDRLWAEDLTVIVPEMPRLAKPDLLEMWRSMKVVFTEYSTTAVRIHVFGQTAVVTGHLHRVRDFGGRAASDDWLFTKTYAERDGRWIVVAYHASIAPER